MKKSISLIGSAGLFIGVGLVSSTGANAVNGNPDCTDQNTVVAGNNTPQVDAAAIQAKLDDALPLICLSGSFVFPDDNEPWFEFADGESQVHFYGIGNTTLTGVNRPVFFSDSQNSTSITIENLSIVNSGFEAFGAVVSENVDVINSHFENNRGNVGGAIWAYGVATVTNSTFIDNTATLDGGAIAALDAIVTNSTFSGNSGTSFPSYGGAIAVDDLVEVTNSTFIGNSVVGAGSEGGAIDASTGRVLFSTFVNNLAADPSGEDIPGNAIYKSGSSSFSVGGNIFSGSSPHPQLGIGGESPTNFEDLGGNVFTTSSATEVDFDAAGSSVFSHSLTALFGTSTPQLGTYAPDTFGTQTIAIVAGSPAIGVVPAQEPFSTIPTDQRGATRTSPYSAGAFELDAQLAQTGTAHPWIPLVLSSLFISLGAFAYKFRGKFTPLK